MRVTPLVILGAGGHGRETCDVVEAMVANGDRLYECIGFLDDGSPHLNLLEDYGVPLLGPLHDLETLSSDVQYVVGIGAGAVRRTIDEWATRARREAAVLVHPSASVGRRRVTLQPGVIIFANASITTNVMLGRHTHINLNATVAHDAVLGDYVTVNPGATISGEVTLGDEVNVGTGGSIIQGVRVGARTVVGAGAAVVRDLPSDIVAVGVPARKL